MGEQRSCTSHLDFSVIPGQTTGIVPLDDFAVMLQVVLFEWFVFVVRAREERNSPCFLLIHRLWDEPRLRRW